MNGKSYMHIIYCRYNIHTKKNMAVPDNQRGAILFAWTQKSQISTLRHMENL